MKLPLLPPVFILAFTLASAPVYAEVTSFLVPVRTIYPKEALRSTDFVFKEFEANEVARRTYLSSHGQLESHAASKALPAGRPVLLRTLRRIADVKKGQQVIARYVAEGIEIMGLLVPEQDGVIGEIVRVRNAETGVILAARVAEDGSLVVTGP